MVFLGPMVIKHFPHMRDNVGCQLLKRNVKNGAMVVGNADNINNEQGLEKKESQLQRTLGNWSLSMRDRNGRRSIHAVSVHVNIYNPTSQYSERRRERMLRTQRKTERQADLKKAAQNKDWLDRKQETCMKWDTNTHMHMLARAHTHTHTHAHVQPTVIMVTFAVCQWLCAAGWWPTAMAFRGVTGQNYH